MPLSNLAILHLSATHQWEYYNNQAVCINIPVDNEGTRRTIQLAEASSWYKSLHLVSQN
jgi:hypothetical protein